MPWIRVLRVCPGLWIGWTENDLHEMSAQALGFTENHARQRVFARID